ncbi:MAG: phosphopantothenoylcysteine decarboxylase [Bacteroidetes bacterium GWA2_31_9]|nr:MAG: phosphopantothenoylcysteine decarboxylase [Bacteroidetes bacterium GWA2_31_9]
MLLEGKKIILGVTGSIAAYKAAILIRLLVKEGAKVKVVMTPSSKEFITPLTLSTLSGSPVMSEFFNQNSGDWNSHVDLGLWADLMLVAPASASTISKMANGIADNLLITTYLSARCPVMVAPAMDLDMLNHKSTKDNLSKLTNFGNFIIEPATGELASGLIGKGRMEEPEVILNKIIDLFNSKKKLKSKRVLITAGPTFEQIDPVRFIGNYSSGKMGFEIAEEMANQGADVKLITGPVSLKANHTSIETIAVKSASEMYNECVKHFQNVDIAVMAAAVADFTPKKVELEKIKKDNFNNTIELVETKDIAAELGRLKKTNQILIGFALETHNESVNATKKLISKNLDFIVLNSLNDKGAGFSFDTNKITIIDKSNNIEHFELKSKAEVATDIVNKICKLL